MPRNKSEKEVGPAGPSGPNQFDTANGEPERLPGNPRDVMNKTLIDAFLKLDLDDIIKRFMDKYPENWDAPKS